MRRGLGEMSQDCVGAQEFLASGDATLERSGERCGCNWSRLSYLADFKSRPEKNPRPADRLGLGQGCATCPLLGLVATSAWRRDNPHKTCVQLFVT